MQLSHDLLMASPACGIRYKVYTEPILWTGKNIVLCTSFLDRLYASALIMTFLLIIWHVFDWWRPQTLALLMEYSPPNYKYVLLPLQGR